MAMQFRHQRFHLAIVACMTVAAAAAAGHKARNRRRPAAANLGAREGEPGQTAAQAAVRSHRMWQHDGRANKWQFVPETFKLTPAAQVHYERRLKALKRAASTATTSASAGRRACRSS
jgi:type II secretory pathway component PulJ